MSIKTLLRWLIKLLLWIFGLVFVGLLVVSYFAIPIDISRIKSPMEGLIGSALDRKVKIEESIIVTTSMKPAFSIKGLRIFNPDSFTAETFMHLDKALVRIELLPLLAKKLHIAQIEVQGLEVNLEKTSDDLVNWAFTPPGNEVKTNGAGGKEEKKTTGKTVKSLSTVTGDSIVVKKLHLTGITVDYHSPGEKSYLYELNTCTGHMKTNEPLFLQFDGKLNNFPYHLNVTLASLEEFISYHQTWLEMTADIADTNFSFSGNVNVKKAHKALTLKTEVNGQDLSSLNSLLGVDLPPFSSYQLKTAISIKPGIFEMQNLSVKTEDSILEGAAVVRQNKEEYYAEVSLLSDLIQLNDFTFDNWSWKQEKEQSISTPPVSTSEISESVSPLGTGKILKLADPEFLSRFDLALQVESRQVLSGQDKLGNGLLSLTLKDGRLSLTPLHLNLPGGVFKLQASVKPGIEGTSASLKMQVENFDIGILARRAKPDTNMSGLVNLDTELSSTASTITDILANGNGYFDFSGQLKNIKAGLIDLWAVNLITAILAGTGEDKSEVNCAVCRWSVKDGILTPDTFFIDTTKIRICGKGQVDFKRNYLDFTVGPTPKRPEFFNLAAPLRVEGSFQDIHFALKKGVLFERVIVFLTSPVHVPVRRIFEHDIPGDGSDSCNIALGPENRDAISVRGCR